MNVLVLLAGIADPKWPLPASLAATTLDTQRATYPLLSPFDEAALELALKLRDADASVQIRALVAASSAQDPLMRHVASFRLDQVCAFDTARWPAWNSAALASALSSWAQKLTPAPDLLLMGREFGDQDDGSLPSTLAQALAWPLSTLVLEATAESGSSVRLLRQQGAVQERVRKDLPAVAAVTNHARNRLRHPLLKNVMAAKKMVFELTDLPDGPPPPALRWAGTALASAPARTTACRMLDGDAAAQARALATLLLTSGETA
ncbi:electron transfer flavoprotein subunit beta [Acidovorax carolinensis]|nr:electron transfer flavoprotein subunit beta [Acidovorax carolinensis]